MPKKVSAAPAWRNAIIAHQEVNPTDLVPHPENWRRHSADQQGAIKASIEQLGWIREILVNRTTGHILDGHARIKEAIANGESQVPVSYVELSPEDERLALLVLDPIAGMAGADHETLEGLLAQTASGHEALQAVLDMLAMEHGFLESLDQGKEPVSLDDEIPPEDPEAFWSIISLRVPPETFSRYTTLMGRCKGESEAERFSGLLHAAEKGLDG